MVVGLTVIRIGAYLTLVVGLIGAIAALNFSAQIVSLEFNGILCFWYQYCSRGIIAALWHV